jgi:uncharacterized damage-inducible protein DinB
MFEDQIALVEADVVSLAEAVPEAVFDFVPGEGAFEGVRTFGEQVRHLATVLYLSAVVLTGKKPPFGPGTGNNGPDSVQARDQALDFLRESFAAARRSIGTLTDENHLDRVPSVFGPVPRSSIASSLLSHSYNHYGQMVVYARMNGVVPPRSVPSGAGTSAR